MDRIFDYLVPPLLEPFLVSGLRVLVPFGPKNTKTEGVIIDISNDTEIEEKKMKSVLEFLDEGQPMFNSDMIKLAIFMKEKYFCSLSQCLLTMMPSGIQTKTTWIIKLLKKNISENNNEAEKEFIEYLENNKDVSVKELEDVFGKKIQTVIKTLQEKKCICFTQNTKKTDFVNKKKKLALSVHWDEVLLYLEKISEDKRFDAQKNILLFFKDNVQADEKELMEQFKVKQSPIKTLIKKGFLREEFEEVRRNVSKNYVFSSSQPFIPTEEQDVVLKKIDGIKKSENKKPILLHGITGSGKTEVYLQLIDKALKENKQAIVLVPEISLTPQMVERFLSRFGSLVSVTHSRLSAGERYDQWKKARDGEIAIMIGPRSALFTPFVNLGVVIIDEEHESSYRSDSTPKYDAREVARELCNITKSLLVLGSATPDLETYYKAQIGEYELLELTKRTNGSTLPSVSIVDMREELEMGNRSVFSRDLYTAIKENLEKKEQTMLFLNRRGFSTFVSCRKCGYVMTCDNCNVSLTYHAKNDELSCHYCGKKIANPTVCPSCGSKYIKYFGTGTQKIEAEVKKMFPNATVLRMDFDTTAGKMGHQNILSQFASGKVDILIGTQMIAKGHDFSGVTLVGIMAADLSLNMGNYNAAETTFGLITQAAGRAGRGELGGMVFIQTYQPEHYSIIFSARQDYKAFYNEEIKLREMMNYPPFSSIFTMLISGLKEEKVMEGARLLGEIMRNNVPLGFEILGPVPASISKIKKEYRWRIIIKHKDEEILKQFALECTRLWKESISMSDVYLNLTMNPRTII